MHQAVITEVFVYGTLQRDQCRGKMWPRKPLAIHTAFVRGQLFDLGPYPAFRCDVDEDQWDWVAGEVWSFTEEDLAETIAELDRIEETNQPDRINLYDRILVRAHPLPNSGESILALAYQYSDAALLSQAKRVGPGLRGHVAWPARSSDLT